MHYYPHDIEPKWQERWAHADAFSVSNAPDGEKHYVLDMFPYPSASGLHVGHVEQQVATDIYSRYLRMRGFSVLHPMGWDAFGLPAENYAIKTGVHPRTTTDNAIATFRQQIRRLGLSYDWHREFGTHEPSYYRFTQWLFTLFFEQGLAYKADARVNWCDSCQTVLANEQVEGGVCERCKSPVVQRELKQWFFKITDYADRLYDELDTVTWPQSTVRNQRNWIGRSEGALLSFSLTPTDTDISVFTTRPDTLYGATYLVLAPEHSAVSDLLPHVSNREAVEQYRDAAAHKTELERTRHEQRTDSEHGKSGIQLAGITARNPATGEDIPVFIADYVLAQYGTGAIMAVPAHDERDYAFATTHELPVRQVVEPADDQEAALPYAGAGTLINSGTFDGLDTESAKTAITHAVNGEVTTTYQLRDWLVSRQRYWGTPIPIVYDPDGNAHPVPAEYLPWELPTDVPFKPTGTSPLAESAELHERVERLFGAGWTPEVDTLDTFVDSSWYYLRFADPTNETQLASERALQQWLPVDMYVGGAEHTVLHLLYARFFTKVLHDLGYLKFAEPFQTLRHQGTILGEDGQKMSKSRGNVINPNTVIDEHGADTMRLYEMFMGSLEESKPWNSDSIIGVRRFLERVARLPELCTEGEPTQAVARELHRTVQKVGEDIESFKFNTAISQMMIFVNTVIEAQHITHDHLDRFIRILAPFAPHLAEELHEQYDNACFTHQRDWPSYDPAQLIDDTVTIPVQINGKIRGEITVAPDASKEHVEAVIYEHEQLSRHVAEKDIQRIIYKPGTIVNIVI
jgi:leucyl-tRNA synthetase